MIKRFITERRSWIFFFFLQQLILLFGAYVDPSISLSAVSYFVFLFTILFFLFLFLRYQKETVYYKQLEERINDLDPSCLPTARSPFETIVEKSIMEQTQHFNQTASKIRTDIEQEKDEMLSWIHEVKTPLTALHLMIQRIDDKSFKAELTYEWLRIHLLLDQQLHQKRIPFIKNDLYMENTDLETLLFSELKTLQSWCIQKGIGFDLDLQITHVLTDTKWLAFIIRQILTNAVKYSNNSDIRIKSYEQDERTYLEIKDFGRGIDARDLSRIFDKGFTSTSQHHDQASTGMGLYLAQKAANSLQINISAQSKLHDGTAFTLVFPSKNEFHQIMGM